MHERIHFEKYDSQKFFVICISTGDCASICIYMILFRNLKKLNPRSTTILFRRLLSGPGSMCWCHSTLAAATSTPPTGSATSTGSMARSVPPSLCLSFSTSQSFVRSFVPFVSPYSFLSSCLQESLSILFLLMM